MSTVSASSSSSPTAATLWRMSGDVRHRGAASRVWRPAQSQQALRANDAVQTMEGARASVRFEASGAEVELEPGTTLSIPSQSRGLARLQHSAGVLHARLAPGGPAQRMEVVLPPGTLVIDARDRGEGGTDTALEARVAVTGESTRIAMVSGTAHLARTASAAIEIAEDRYVSVDRTGHVIDEGAVGAEVEVTSPAPGATVRTRGPVAFAWQAVPSAHAYRIDVWSAADEGARTTRRLEDTEVTLRLRSGAYHYTVRGMRDGVPLPAHAARTLSVTVDRRPPALVVNAPAAGAVVSGSSVLVTGRAEAGASVEIDGHAVDVDAEGRFRVVHALDLGLSNVVIRATDDVGNSRHVSRTVLRDR